MFWQGQQKYFGHFGHFLPARCISGIGFRYSIPVAPPYRSRTSAALKAYFTKSAPLMQTPHGDTQDSSFTHDGVWILYRCCIDGVWMVYIKGAFH